MSGFFNKAHCLLLGLVHCLMLVRSALFVQYFFFFFQPFTTTIHNLTLYLLTNHGEPASCTLYPAAHWQ